MRGLYLNDLLWMVYVEKRANCFDIVPPKQLVPDVRKEEKLKVKVYELCRLWDSLEALQLCPVSLLPSDLRFASRVFNNYKKTEALIGRLATVEVRIPEKERSREIADFYHLESPCSSSLLVGLRRSWSVLLRTGRTSTTSSLSALNGLPPTSCILSLRPVR